MKFFAVFLLIQACNSSQPDTTGMDTIRIQTNDTFDIKLGAVLGTGFRWMLSDSAYQSILRLDTSYIVQTKDIDGEPETQVFKFRALKKGKVTLNFMYRRSWKKKDPPDKERKFRIIIQ